MENKNKLIAEFMGLKDRIENDFSRYGDGYTACRYHESWGWLMQVVEKIESLDLKEYGYQWEGIDGKTEYNNGSICVEIEGNRCWIYMNLSLDPFHTFNEKSRGIEFPTKLEATYAAVVEFIEYYNILIRELPKPKQVDEVDQEDMAKNYTEREVVILLQDCAIHFGIMNKYKDDGTFTTQIDKWVKNKINKQDNEN